MDLSRRDLFKLGGTAAAALGLSQLKVLNAHATEGRAGVDVYAFQCGILKTQTQYILKDTRVGVPFDVPVPFFLIRHGSSWVAYDSGNNAAVAVDPIKYWGQAVCDAYMPVMKPHEEFKIQIKKLGLKPEDLYAVIMSHGHLDHCGALEDLAGTDVPIYLHKNELEQIKKEVASGKKSAYIPDDFNKIGQCNVRTLDGIFDVFGDQSVIVLPTPGHTPGHQSILVRTNNGQNLILAQDACYTLENMFANIPPGLAFDIPDSMISIYHFKAMAILGAQLVPPHDPDWWQGKPFAPQLFRV
jgi:glyoxylase-like metal-dependent hydrolase (beta-lactamase superfamily II)